jgi:hypothetical protein
MKKLIAQMINLFLAGVLKELFPIVRTSINNKGASISVMIAAIYSDRFSQPKPPKLYFHFRGFLY